VFLYICTAAQKVRLLPWHTIVTSWAYSTYMYTWLFHGSVYLPFCSVPLCCLPIFVPVRLSEFLSVVQPTEHLNSAVRHVGHSLKCEVLASVLRRKCKFVKGFWELSLRMNGTITAILSKSEFAVRVIWTRSCCTVPSRSQSQVRWRKLFRFSYSCLCSCSAYICWEM
jgi:hypothetical protein